MSVEYNIYPDIYLGNMGYNMMSMCHDIDFCLPLVKSGEYDEH